MAILFGLAMLAWGVYLFMNHTAFDLPYKYRGLFGSTKNAAVFIVVVGAGLTWFGLRRSLNGRAGIVMNDHGFMDSRYLKAPIPWSWINGHQMAETEIMGQHMEVLALIVQPGAKSDIAFNWNYRFNNWVKSSEDQVVAFTLQGLEDQDHYELQNAFNFWLNRYPAHKRHKIRAGNFCRRIIQQRLDIDKQGPN